MKILRPTILIIIASLSVSSPVWAKGQGGNNFRSAADGLLQKAQAQEHEGNSELASVYREMARFKREAADMADRDAYDSIDWTRFQELSQQARELMREAIEAKTPARKPPARNQ